MNVTLRVIEWQIVIDDKSYEMGPRANTRSYGEFVLVGICPYVYAHLLDFKIDHLERALIFGNTHQVRLNPLTRCLMTT